MDAGPIGPFFCIQGECLWRRRRCLGLAIIALDASPPKCFVCYQLAKFRDYAPVSAFHAYMSLSNYTMYFAPALNAIISARHGLQSRFSRIVNLPSAGTPNVITGPTLGVGGRALTRVHADCLPQDSMASKPLAQYWPHQFFIVEPVHSEFPLAQAD